MKNVIKFNTADQAKPIPLNEYINRMKNLGFEDDQIQGMIMSLEKRRIIAIDSTTSMVEFLTCKV